MKYKQGHITNYEFSNAFHKYLRTIKPEYVYETLFSWVKPCMLGENGRPVELEEMLMTRFEAKEFGMNHALIVPAYIYTELIEIKEVYGLKIYFTMKDFKNNNIKIPNKVKH